MKARTPASQCIPLHRQSFVPRMPFVSPQGAVHLSERGSASHVLHVPRFEDKAQVRGGRLSDFLLRGAQGARHGRGRGV